MFGKKKIEEDLTPPATDEMPVLPHRVLHVGIPFYSDAACTQLVEGAHLLILEPLDPDDAILELDVVPTRLDYKQGQLVHFLTDHHQMWEASWYHSPITGQVEKAWKVVAAGFVGPVISDETVAKHKKFIDDLESRLARRKAPTASTTVN